MSETPRGGEALTPQKVQIVELIAAGLTRWAIAERLGINENTVRQYVRALCKQYDCPMRDLPEMTGISAPPDLALPDDEGEITFLGAS